MRQILKDVYGIEASDVNELKSICEGIESIDLGIFCELVNRDEQNENSGQVN